MSKRSALAAGMMNYMSSYPHRVRRTVFGRRRRTRRGGHGRVGSMKIPKTRYKKSLMWTGSGYLPQKYLCTMKFQTWYTHTTATPGFYDWVFRGNSIYDPDYAFSTESATGFDSMMLLFNHWNVHASNIRIRAVNNDTDDPVDITVIPTRFANSFAVANANAVRAMPLAKYIVVSNQHGSGIISHSAKTKDVCGVKDDSDIGFIGDSGNNPTHAWYWHIVTNNHSANALNLQMWVEIDYKTEFSDHYPVTQ